ncbi:hypothetical protein D9M69_641910 [compost metagenome]
MHTFHFRPINEDFAIWARIRQTFDKPWIELERKGHARSAIGIRLIRIGTQCGFDQIAETAQNLIIIDARHAKQCGLDGIDQLLFSRITALGRWIEAQIK